MDVLKEKQLDSAKKAAHALSKAAGGMRVLSSLNWDVSMREAFLKRGVLPTPDYPNVDTSAAREAIAAARQHIDGGHVVMRWLERTSSDLESTANMMDTRGTAEFYQHSSALYGCPTKLMLDGETKVLDLALSLIHI